MPRRSFPWIPTLVAAGIVGLGAHFLMPVLVPFALGCAAAYILNPLPAAAEVRGMRREAVVIGGYLLGAALLALLAGTLLPLLGKELALLREDAPALLARLRLSWLDFQRSAIAHAPFLEPQLRKLDPAVALGPLVDQAVSMPSYALSAVPLLMLLFLVPFISFFLLMDGPASIESMIQRCPSRYVEQALHLVSEIDRSLGAYLRGLILVAAALTAASFLGLALLGVTQAFWIALLCGVSSFVPYLGAVMGMVVGGAVAAFQYGTLAAALKVIVLFLLIRLGDEMFLQPFIAKRSVHLHPLLFLFTFMTGGELFGFIGLLFAVPVACVIKALVEVAWSWYSSEAQLEAPLETDAAPVPYT
jgi:predicted PurR-regulated permease PerM